MILGSATKAIGVRSLLDIVIDSFPSPADRPPVEGTDPRNKETVTRAASPKEPFSALVFKTLTDPHVGKLTLFRVFSGVITGNSQVYNPARETRERVGQVALLQGREHKTVESLGAGEIGVVLKLKETLTGDTLCAENAPVILPRIQFPEPAISFALQPKAKGDEDKISNALARLAEEDPTLRYHYDPETKQLLISGVGQLHIEVTLERMKRKFNAEVVLCRRGSPTRRPSRAGPRSRAGTRSRRAAGASSATAGSRSSRSRGAQGSNSSTRSSAARSPGTSYRRWRRACAPGSSAASWPGSRSWTCA